jgi:protein ImuB
VPPCGHRPEAFSLSPFVPSQSDALPTAPGNGAGWVARAGGRDGSNLALRALRPPEPAEVFLEGGQIAYVRASGLGGRALLAAGPWRVEAEWWSESPCRRDYWEVQLSDGGVYRLYREAARWWIDGRYD